MTTIDSWPVEISLREQDGKTLAKAQLTRGGVGMIGHGRARRNPMTRRSRRSGRR